MTETTQKAPKTPSPAKDYPGLTANFFRGQFAGQLSSVFKNRDNPEKVASFKKAIADGKVTIPTADLTAQQKSKLDALGISY